MQTQELAGGSCSTMKGHLTPVVILPHVTLHVMNTYSDVKQCKVK